MPGFTAVGVASKTTLLMENKAGLYVEFIANAQVYKGQPVKLTTAGQVTPLLAGDFQSLMIGIALSDQIATNLVTVLTRSVAMIWALANAATQNCVPVTYTGYDTTHNTNVSGGITSDYSGTLGYSLFGASTVEAAGVVSTQHGWALDQSVSQYDLIRVLIKN